MRRKWTVTQRTERESYLKIFQLVVLINLKEWMRVKKQFIQERTVWTFFIPSLLVVRSFPMSNFLLSTKTMLRICWNESFIFHKVMLISRDLNIVEIVVLNVWIRDAILLKNAFTFLRQVTIPSMVFLRWLNGRSLSLFAFFLYHCRMKVWAI